jgi:hypothetical protein
MIVLTLLLVPTETEILWNLHHMALSGSKISGLFGWSSKISFNAAGLWQVKFQKHEPCNNFIQVWFSRVFCVSIIVLGDFCNRNHVTQVLEANLTWNNIDKSRYKQNRRTEHSHFIHSIYLWNCQVTSEIYSWIQERPRPASPHYVFGHEPNWIDYVIKKFIESYNSRPIVAIITMHGCWTTKSLEANEPQKAEQLQYRWFSSSQSKPSLGWAVIRRNGREYHCYYSLHLLWLGWWDEWLMLISPIWRSVHAT